MFSSAELMSQCKSGGSYNKSMMCESDGEQNWNCDGCKILIKGNQEIYTFEREQMNLYVKQNILISLL